MKPRVDYMILGLRVIRRRSSHRNANDVEDGHLVSEMGHIMPSLDGRGVLRPVRYLVRLRHRADVLGLSWSGPRGPAGARYAPRCFSLARTVGVYRVMERCFVPFAMSCI